MLYALLIGVCWLIFIVFWIVSALSAKRTLRRGAWWQFAGWRLFVIVVVLWLIHIGYFNGFNHAYWFVPFNPLISGIGLACCAAGIALAIWARVYLGRNWGMPMSVKESPELVTTGPYAYVRHPIYTGVLLAIFGTILTSGAWWIVLLMATGVYFIYSATQEEKIMLKEFPGEYPAYKKRTKMLIPFIF
ncbi:MAG: isoprenylcysteine carboxylmethyltransferase family protein [Patescibacteria group bacterium]|nr:isoprenylcysteine carboxylmethyltransferase family protein [Patescibacteria group bacterium]